MADQKPITLDVNSPEQWNDPELRPILEQHYGADSNPTTPPSDGGPLQGAVNFAGDLAKNTIHDAGGFMFQNENDFKKEAGSPAAQFGGSILGALPYYMGPRAIGGAIGTVLGLPEGGIGALPLAYIGQAIGGALGGGGYSAARRIDELHDSGQQPTFSNVAPWVAPAVAQSLIPGSFGSNTGQRIATGAGLGWLRDVVGRALDPQNQGKPISYNPGIGTAIEGTLPIAGHYIDQALQGRSGVPQANPAPAPVSDTPEQTPLAGNVTQTANPAGQPLTPFSPEFETLAPHEQEQVLHAFISAGGQNAAPAAPDQIPSIEELQTALQQTQPGSPEEQALIQQVRQLLAGGSQAGAPGKL